ncbi:MAG: phosphoribosylformylglycinamidine synthase subunit PurQ [Leptospirillia bacterium]
MTVGIVVFPGSNCDHDVHHVITTLCGGAARFIWHKETDLSDVSAIVLPGGFSYGDYLRCGAIAHVSPVMAEVKRFAAAGRPVLGICNGFQIMVESGILPGALVRNRDLRFICKDACLTVESTDSPYTENYRVGEVVNFPIAHADGNYEAHADTIKALEDQGRVAFRYASADGVVDDAANPNGSMNNIAGIFGEHKNVLGMMPHPERMAEALLGGDCGSGLFRGLLAHISEAG